MEYAFSPHLASMAGAPVDRASWPASKRYALIDAAAPKRGRAKGGPLLNHVSMTYLFEDEFANGAMDLSPNLFELDDNDKAFGKQIDALDRICGHLPAMAVLSSKRTLIHLNAQLRSVMRVKSGSDKYLLRFADTQMLAAVNAVFTPSQRARFFDGIEAWYWIDHDGALHNALEEPHETPMVELPLRLDEKQTVELANAVTVPALASQMRNLEAAFAQNLTHAEQTRFASECVRTAISRGTDLDSTLLSQALARWQFEFQNLHRAHRSP